MVEDNGADGLSPVFRLVVCVSPDSPVPVGGAGGSLAGVFPEPEPV